MKRLNLFACASAFLLILVCASAAEEGAEGAAQPEDESGERNQAEGDSEAKRQAKGFDNVSADDLKNISQQAQRVGEYGLAAAFLLRAIQMSGTAEMWNLLGEAFYELEQYFESYEAFQTALEIDPKYARAIANMEKVKRALPPPGAEDFDDASADDLKKMVQLERRRGEYSKAAALLEQAVQKSEMAKMWNLLGEWFYRLEQYFESYEAFQTALEIDPKYTRAVDNMEMVKWKLSLPGAEGFNNLSADGLIRMVQQERRRGEYGKAAALLEQAVQKNGTAEMWNLLGETYYELERYVEAYEAFQTALEINPKYTPAVANIEVVKWALPQPSFEDSMQQRFSTPKTIGTQILSSYFTGTAMGGWLLFVSYVGGYKEVDDQLTIMASGLVLSSMMRVPEVGRLVSFGHGASRSAFAGAVLPPLIGALVVRLSNENPTRRDLINGARIGAIFSPLVSTLGYHLSTSRLLKHPRSTAQHTPFERTETQLSMQFAQFSF